MDDLCRICLQSLQGKYKLLLSETFKGLRLFEYINLITNIVIKEDDGLPSTMCNSCYREFETVMSFREKCEKSDIKLKELQIKNEIVIELKQESHIYLELENYNSDIKAMPILKPSTSVKYENKPDLSPNKEYLTCGKCNAIFKTRRTLHIHQTRNKCEAAKFECDDCGEVFKSKCKIAVHWKKKHLLSALICPKCKKKCKSFAALKNHKLKRNCRRIDDQLICIEGVGKSRVFNCKKCSYSTKAIISIIVHTRLHTGERPYKCSYCPRSFTQISTLYLHQDYIHKESTLIKVPCLTCGKLFEGKKRLQAHIARSHDDPVVICTVCNKSLLSRSLEKHMARHTDHKNFTCEVCAESFYSLSELCNHKRIVH